MEFFMKKLSRLLALVLALALALTIMAPAFAEETAADPVLFTFDGEEVTLSQINEVLYNMYNNGYLDSTTDYDAGIEALIQNKVVMSKIAELGFDQFTPEEEEALRIDA